MISSNVPPMVRANITTAVDDVDSSSRLDSPHSGVRSTAAELATDQRELDSELTAPPITRAEKIDRSTARLITIISNRDRLLPHSQGTGNAFESPREQDQTENRSPISSTTNVVTREEMRVRQIHSASVQGGDGGMGSAQGQVSDPVLPQAPFHKMSRPSATSATQSTHSLLKYYAERDSAHLMQREEIEDMVRHSAIANSLYYDFESELLKAERILTKNPSMERTTWRRFELPAEIQTALGMGQFDDGRLFHEKSDIVALILQNAEIKSVIVAFGGTTAGKNKGSLIYRLLTNPISTFKHWRRNLQSIGLPFTSKLPPDSYIKGAEIAKSVEQLIKNDPERYAGYQISVTGHSKGAAEAEFATLQHPAIRSVCFSTPPLGTRVLKHVPRENFDMAKDNIQHYFVKHDLIPSINVTLTRFLSTAHIGTGQWLPAPASIISGPFYLLWAHDSFNHCVGDYATRNAIPGIPNTELGDTCITIDDVPEANPEVLPLRLPADLHAQTNPLKNDERV